MKTIITKKQLDTLKNIKELSFRKIKSFTDYSLASGIEEIDITNVNKKIRSLKRTSKTYNNILNCSFSY